MPQFDDNSFSEVLLAIHRLSRKEHPDRFPVSALGALLAILPFDSAIWGTATQVQQNSEAMTGWQVHAVHLHNQSSEMMAQWAQISHLDTLSFEAFNDPGRTINISLPDPDRDVHPDMLAHCQRYGMIHSLSTVIINEQLGIANAISLYRSVDAGAYSETERHTAELVAPHMIEAWNVNLVEFLHQQSNTATAGGMTRGISDTEGVVYNADPMFAELLSLEWPGWRGPQLPNELVGRLQDLPFTFEGDRIRLHATLVTDLAVLVLKQRSVTDRLTERELEVAEQFGQGQSYKEIARRLEVSPSTVRNHLQSIYRKLKVTNKVELANVLDPDHWPPDETTED